MKKNIFLFLFLTLVFIGILNYFNSLFSELLIYIFSIIGLVLGILIYPFNYKLETKVDFLILPVITLLIFNFVILLFSLEFSLKLVFINYLFGLFGFLQYFYYKNNLIKDR